MSPVKPVKLIALTTHHDALYALDDEGRTWEASPREGHHEHPIFWRLMAEAPTL